MRLTEDLTKDWLRDQGLPVPQGAAADSPEAAVQLAQELAGPVVVKALVPTGRRGKAGAVLFASRPSEVQGAAEQLLGQTVGGHFVSKVYVERQFPIAEELYLSFAFGPRQPKVLLSRQGGVEIEDTFKNHPEAVVGEEIDPSRGVRPWHLTSLWERAGVSGALLPRLARIGSELFQAFQKADGLILEINPIAVDAEGNPSLVGAMLEIDNNALFRHPIWEALSIEEGGVSDTANERERRVLEANKTFPGGAIRYDELDGDIGLLVAGGGAGLLQHDMIIAAGGRPANHTDISPGPTPEKMTVLLEAVFDNPKTTSLLVGYNHLQMAPCDQVTTALVAAIQSRKIDPRRFPIVIRLFGPKEQEARKQVGAIPGIHYLPPDATLQEGVQKVVELNRKVNGMTAEG